MVDISDYLGGIAIGGLAMIVVCSLAPSLTFGRKMVAGLALISLLALNSYRDLQRAKNVAIEAAARAAVLAR